MTETVANESQRGFTLIEILAAVAIFGLVATAVYGTFSGTLGASAHASERLALFGSARRALDWIERDLKGSFNTGRYRPGQPRFVGQGEEDTLLDLTVVSAVGMAEVGLLSHGGPRGDQARVAYRLEDRQLVRYEVRPPGPLLWESATRNVIATNIETVELRFFDGSRWHETWVAQGPDRPVPVLVDCRLTIDGGSGPAFSFSSAVALPLGGRP